MGVRFSRKSPESLSTKRHLPSDVWVRLATGAVQRHARVWAAGGWFRGGYLDLNVGECTGGGVVPLLSLGGGGFVERGDRPGQGNWAGRNQRGADKNGRQSGNHLGGCSCVYSGNEGTGSTSFDAIRSDGYELYAVIDLQKGRKPAQQEEAAEGRRERRKEEKRRIREKTEAIHTSWQEKNQSWRERSRDIGQERGSEGRGARHHFTEIFSRWLHALPSWDPTATFKLSTSIAVDMSSPGI